MASTTPRAFGLGPLETIVSVQWLSGFFVYVEAFAVYDQGSPGSREGSVHLTLAGAQAGGVILDQTNDQIAEVVDGDDPHPAWTVFKALLKFTKQPKRLGTVMFSVTLTGSITRNDDTQPPPLIQPFCGTVTSVGRYGNVYAIPVEGNPNPNAFLAQDVDWEYTTPAGTSTAHFTNGPLSDVSAEQVGKGAFTISGSVQTIWYQDAFGNYIDTGSPCSELPIGGPPQPALRTEGWQSVKLEVLPKAGYKALDKADWNTGESIIQDVTRAVGSNVYGGPSWKGLIGQRVSGINSDFQPIFDDLPSCTIDFTTVFASLRNIPKNAPPALFKTFAVIPQSPSFAGYSLIVAVNRPYRQYKPPQEAIPGTSFPVAMREKLFAPTQVPDVGQDFNSI